MSRIFDVCLGSWLAGFIHFLFILEASLQDSYIIIIIIITVIIIIIIIIIINNNNNKCPGYDIKLHPVVEFRRGIMRLPFAAITSRSPLSKV